MLKETITYLDLEGNERTEDFYFNLNKPELMELQSSAEGGFSSKIEAAVKSKDVVKMAAVLKEVVLKAYGVKSSDGKRFIKSKELRDEFEQSVAYEVLFDKLYTEEGYAEKFVNGVIPVIEQPKPQIPNVTK